MLSCWTSAFSFSFSSFRAQTSGTSVDCDADEDEWDEDGGDVRMKEEVGSDDCCSRAWYYRVTMNELVAGVTSLTDEHGSYGDEMWRREDQEVEGTQQASLIRRKQRTCGHTTEDRMPSVVVAFRVANQGHCLQVTVPLQMEEL